MKIEIDREVFHQIMRRASSRHEGEAVGGKMSLDMGDAAARLADASAELIGGMVIVDFTSAAG